MNAIAASPAGPWVTRLGWCLVHSIWQVAVVGLAAAIALRLLRRHSAMSRYLGACAALAIMAALPIATFCSPGSRSDAEQPRVPLALQASPEPNATDAAETKTPNAAGPLHFEGAVQPSRPELAALLEPWLPAVVIAWGLGVLLVSARLLGGFLVVRSLTRRGTRPIESNWHETLARLSQRLALRTPVRLLESARIQVPMVIGWWRPLILLPATVVTGIPSDQLALILGHELAHIKRYDYLVNLVQSVIEAIFFYHPAVWWISTRIREEREHCCDDAAVALCTDRLEYARALSALEHMRAGTWTLTPAASGGTLLARIRRILGVTPVEDSRARGLAGTVILTAIAFLGVALFIAPGTTPARAAIEERKVVTGTVVTSEGKPVAGADVWLVGGRYPQPGALVIDQTRSDATGHYRLNGDETRFQGQNIGSRALWVHRPGFQLVRAMLLDQWTQDGVDPDAPIRLTLTGIAGAVAVRIIDPSGNAVTGASVTIFRLQGEQISLPADLGARLAGVTDADGRAAIQGSPGEMIQTLQVTTPDFGIQLFTHEKGFRTENELRLRPVATVVGRVLADDPSVIRGLHIHLESIARLEDGAWASSSADVISDGEGRFPFRELMDGDVSAEARIPAYSNYRQLASGGNAVLVNGEKITLVDVRLERWVKVRGNVVEKGTGRPVESVGIRFGNQRFVGPILLVGKTDASGHFDAIAPRGKETFCHPDIPKGYLKLSRGIEMPEIKAEGQTLPTIELERGVTLRGMVIDETGKPVAGARVTGSWDRVGPGFKDQNGATMFLGSKFSATARSDAAGQFVLEGIHEGANVMLQAEAGEARTEAPRQAAAGLVEPVKLMISGANTVSLEGRVIDSAGKPVPDVVVQIGSRPLGKDSLPGPGPLRLPEGAIRTDQEGYFKTSRQIKRGFAYRAEVKPDDPSLMSDNSPWLPLRPDTKAVLGDVVLRRLRTVEGRVADRQGQPVAGAVVRQSGDGPVATQTETDANGHFRLSGVLAEPAFIFGAKEGYRFQGQSIAANASSVELTISRLDEPTKPMTTLPSSLTRSAELRLIHLLFDGYAERVIKSGTQAERGQVFRVLTKQDPSRALILLGREEFAAALNPVEYWRGVVAIALFKLGKNDALDLIAATRDPGARSSLYQEAFDVLPPADKLRKSDLLNESLIAGKAVAEPADRVLRLADLGRRFIDAGEPEKGVKLLRDARDMAQLHSKKGWPAFARVYLANELALTDLPASLELLKGTEEEPDHERFLGHIAHRLAGTNPAEAERVLRMMHDHWPYFRDMYTQCVCHRMVTIDKERALNLARKFMTNYRYKARALGAMALALARTRNDRKEATALLSEAFALLERTSGGKDDFWDGLSMACTVAASLLPIVEQVDAGLVSEYLWRTLAMRPSWRSGDGRDQIPLIAGTRVAAIVARYDREAARQILDGLAEAELMKAASAGEREATFYLDSLMNATAFVAPSHAGPIIARLPDSTGEADFSPRNRARLAFVNVLATPAGPERWRLLERSFLHVWPIGLEAD